MKRLLPTLGTLPFLPNLSRGGGGGGSAPISAALPLTIAHGAINTWHFSSTVYDPARSEVLVGAAMGNGYNPTGDVVSGEQSILRFGMDGAYLGRRTVKTGATLDDHNNPAVLIHGGRLIVAVNDHGATNLTTFYRSTDTNPANLSAGTAVDMGGATSYGQFNVIGSTIYFVVQINDTRWEVWQNTTGGDPTGWTKTRNLMTSSTIAQIYCTTRVVGTSIAVLAWPHPVNYATDEGSLRMAVLDPTSQTAVWETMSEILDVGPALRTRVTGANADLTQFVFARFVEGTTGAHDMVLARLTGADRTNPAHWTTELLQTTYGIFWADSAYVEGADLARTVGATATTLLLGLSDNAAPANRTLERWSRALPGDAWTKVTLATSTNRGSTSGSYFNARPIIPAGVPGNYALLNSILDFNNFAGVESGNDPFRSRIVALAGDGPIRSDAIRRNGANVGLSGSKLVAPVQYAQFAETTDIAVWAPTFDLTAAQAGDLVVLSLINNIPVANINRVPTSVTIGGLVLTLQVSTTDTASRQFIGIYSGTVPAGGLTGATSLVWPVVQGYQDCGLAFYRGVASHTPITTRIEATADAAGTYAFAAGDVVIGLSMNLSGSTVEVSMRPDVLVARRVIGVSTTARAYYGFGVAGAGTPTTWDAIPTSGASNTPSTWAVWR